MQELSAEEERLVRWLREARRVLAFCGAGVSAESGVPTFRDAGGLWEGHRVEEVATPEAFAADPRRVWRFYALRLARLATVSPNPAHEVLAAMERHFEETLVVTQNVDDLHERAGSRSLVKLHGSIRETRCTRCGTVSVPEEPVSEAVVARGDLPRCGCGGLLRPNVVWFGEYLDPAHLQRIERFFQRTAGSETLVLVIGTSGLVSGGYGIPGIAYRSGARSAEINPAASALSDEVDLALRAPAGELLGRIWPRVTGG
ncbi:MAG: SIR2 family NAD-dependent protein deacylase [Armatimonadota bacterium]